MPQKSSIKANDADDEALVALPALTEGQSLWCHQGEIADKQTQPPAYFTDATLLAAMTGISRFVADKALQAVLKETDGLGTEATRASIIELLFSRQFLRREGKQIRATELGKALIRVLPESTTLPDRTARWEQQLNRISERQLKYQGFMQPLEQELQQLVSEARGLDIQGLSGIKIEQSKGGYKRKRRRSPGKTGQAAPRKKAG